MASYQTDTKFEKFINTNKVQTSAWIKSLSYGEKFAALIISQMRKKIIIESGDDQAVPEYLDHHIQDEKRHCKILNNLITPTRELYSSNSDYLAFEKKNNTLVAQFISSILEVVEANIPSAKMQYFTAASLLEVQVMKHYKKFADCSKNEKFQKTLMFILDDEIEHTNEMTREMKAMDSFNPKLFVMLQSKADDLFSELTVKATTLHEGFMKSSNYSTELTA